MSILTILKMLLKDTRHISDYSDSRLLKLIRQDDQKAFEMIFEHYWGPLFDFVLLRVQSVDPTREIVQDIFISLWVKRKFAPLSNLQSYLYEDADARLFHYPVKAFKSSLKKGVLREKYVYRTQLEYDSFRRNLENVQRG